VSEKVIGDVSVKINPSGILLIPENIADRLNSFRQTCYGSTEAGGILLGKQYENKLDIIVEKITTPLNTDKRARHSFYRSKGHHNIAVERWKQSGGSCLYLGLWHTHPEAVPSPSQKDYYDWRKALNEGEYEGNKLFFIIIGIKEVRCWQGNRISGFKKLIHSKNKFKQLSMSHE